MLRGRCFWELSGRKLQRRIKRSQTPSEADLSRRAVEESAVPRTSPGNAKFHPQTELSSRPERSVIGEICGFLLLRAGQQTLKKPTRFCSAAPLLQGNQQLHRQKVILSNIPRLRVLDPDTGVVRRPER